MRLAALSAILLSCGALVACSQSGNSTPTADASQALVSDQPLVTGVPEIARINKAGGTKIAVLVNNTAITSNDIRRRAAFVKLRRMKGNANSIARQELIEEAMKMEEAKRIRTVASQAQVDAAYVNFAKRNKMPVSALTRVLNQRGVTKRGFEQFIRSQMSWQRAVATRLRAEGKSDSGPKRQQAWLSEPGTKLQTEKTYTLQQIIFLVPASKKKLLAARKAEATRFRTGINGCKSTKVAAAGLKDVAVRELGRVREAELPPRWAKHVKNTGEGQPTTVLGTEKGAELLVVCKTREIQSAAGGEGDAFAGGSLQTRASELEKKYLAELKERAIIKER